MARAPMMLHGRDAWRGYRILVVGAGSIGQRHMRNLRSLGIQHLAACDPNPDRLITMVAEYAIQPFADFETAMAKVRPEVVWVCTPPVFHVSQAVQAVRMGAHVFIEKPLSHTLNEVDELMREVEVRQRIVQVGYNLRFHPGIRKVKALVDEGAIGKILWVWAEMGQYLPDWRPGRDYRRDYTAQRELGGGILLDGSHELDYVIWLLGRPIEVMCMAGKTSDLDVDVEDSATVLLRFASGARADVHVDFVQQGYARSCKLVGTRGTIVWDYAAQHVQLYDTDTEAWQTMTYHCDSNDMYMAEIQHFLDCINEGTPPLIDLEQAKFVLKVALAARAAAAHGHLEFI